MWKIKKKRNQEYTVLKSHSNGAFLCDLGILASIALSKIYSNQ